MRIFKYFSPKKIPIEFIQEKLRNIMNFKMAAIVAMIVFTIASVVMTRLSFTVEDLEDKQNIVKNTEQSKESSINNSKGISNNAGEKKSSQKSTLQKNKSENVNLEKGEVKNTKSNSNSKQNDGNVSKVNSNEVINPIKPLDGEVLLGFSKSKLVYSKTLDEWRVHEGIDIASGNDGSVKVVMDGIVLESREDKSLGYVIAVDHNNGYKTVYGSLDSNYRVSINQKVKKGDIIGKVGNSAKIEISEKPHLHFEVFKDNKRIDPDLLIDMH